MKKFDIVVLIALASYVATEFLNNVFNTLYDKHMKSFVENYITIVAKYITITEIIVIVVCVFLIILLYFVWKYHLKSKELEKELEKEKKKYEKHMGYGIAVRALIVEIENILTDILQEAKDVSMYIVHKDTIYNFLTLPYDTTGIHHQNKTFTLDRNTIIGQAFLNKEESERKLSDSSQTSQELEKSIKMYNLDPNDYLITIPYKKKDNSVLFALQVITDESDSSKKRTIKNNLSKIKNPLENLMELPDWKV